MTILKPHAMADWRLPESQEPGPAYPRRVERRHAHEAGHALICHALGGYVSWVLADYGGHDKPHVRHFMTADIDSVITVQLAGLAGEIYCLSDYRMPGPTEIQKNFDVALDNANRDIGDALEVLVRHEPAPEAEHSRRIILACKRSLELIDTHRDAFLRLRCALDDHGFLGECAVLSALYGTLVIDPTQTYLWAASAPNGHATAITVLEKRSVGTSPPEDQ